MILLKRVAIDKNHLCLNEKIYPFSTNVIRSFESISFDKSVTFLIGENGSGKSTLIEGIASAVGSIVVGNSSIETDMTLKSARRLAETLKLTWTKKTKKGFFLRAEDFFNFSRKIREEQEELQNMANEFDKSLSGYGRQLAMGTVLGQKRAFTQKYGRDLDEFSHGESFLTLFKSRFQPGGLYLLDEPEAALSPISQIALLSMIKDMVEQDSQFIIATHSPILMALPDAALIDVNQCPPQTIAYDDVEHVKITRAFLKDPENYLRRL